MRVGQRAVGRGKRGGVRVYYLDLPARAVTHLVAIFGKREKDDLSPNERKAAAALVPTLKEGSAMKRKNTSAFEKIQASLQDAIDYHRGKRVLTVRDVHLAQPAPMRSKDIVALRSRLKVSQAAFARLLNVSPRTVQAWESNARTPSDAALKLLHVAKRHPEVLLEGVNVAA